MTAIELKASLLNSIKEIDDVNLIERISRYVRKAIGESQKNKITKADLVIDPRALDIIKNLKGGPAFDDKAAIHKHWEEKYK
jgi:hypothetical protein